MCWKRKRLSGCREGAASSNGDYYAVIVVDQEVAADVRIGGVNWVLDGGARIWHLDRCGDPLVVDLSGVDLQGRMCDLSWEE